mgnify:CR=1 FL=1
MNALYQLLIESLLLIRFTLELWLEMLNEILNSAC